MSRLRLGPAPRARVVRVVVAALVVLAAGAALGLALRTVFAPPPVPASATDYALVDSAHGTVERSIRLDVTARRSGGVDLVNAADGVLTERLVPQGEKVSTGDALYSVDLVPVVVASGDVPVFRALSRGDEGDDVRQLQEMLVAVGLRTTPAEGEFGIATEQQVRAWQERAGLPVTGAVPAGQVVFVPGLPGVADWAADVPLGTRLSSGTVVGHVVPDEVTFEMTLPEGQQQLVEPGMTVEITVDDARLAGRLGEIRPGDDATVGAMSAIARIEPAAGAASVCDGRCEDVATAGEQLLPAQVVVTPPTAGTTVPVAAVEVGASGATQVTLADGTAVPVAVSAVDSGQAVVDGLEPGVRVRVPVGTQDAGTTTGPVVP